jgi:DDE superfamily endonuclease
LVVIDIYRQKVLRIYGPRHAGENDITVFRLPGGIMELIPPGKKLIGDSGFRGEPDKITTPSKHDSLDVEKLKQRARACQETFFKRIKDYQILRQEFRSEMQYHQMVFEAVCVLVQYDMENGHPLFEI